MEDDKKAQLQEKMTIIKEKLNDILADEDIELAFCLFRIKDNPGLIRTEVGHFYDITRELSTVVRENHQRMSGEVGI